MRMLAIALVAGTTLGLAPIPASLSPIGCAIAQEAEEATLPVRKITLYRSGVGYFEHQTRLRGTQKVQLRFETDQINDILKSMVLLAFDGARVGAVSYGSKEPLDRRLGSFGVDISNAPTIAELFQQLRGAQLQVTTPDGPIEGTILGVERRSVPVSQGEGTVFEEAYVNLVTSRGIRSVGISRITAFELVDKQLREELNKALAALAEHRADRVKTVDISFAGPQEQVSRMVVSYIHEMPVWKTSYRLILPESGEPTMHGWAIVENTTDHDWKEVQLSLASGRPVSFTMDLYEPLFAPRPEVPVPFLAGLAPRLYEAGRRVAGTAADDRARFADKQAFGKAAPSAAMESATRGGAAGQEDMNFSYDASEFLNYAATAQATGGEVGEQFFFKLDAPVTLERQRSAMLPILSSNIEGRRVSIFNPNQMPDHPMRGVELDNSTGMHLMPGPISVYDGTEYAGDAQIPHTSRNQQRLLSYAVDLDVQAQTEYKSASHLMNIRIVDGLLEQITKMQQSRIYSFENNDGSRDRTILVEHMRSPGWDLVEPRQPAEETEQLYRFEVIVKAQSEQELTVTEEQVTSHRIGVTSIDMPTLLGYARNGKASQAVVDAVSKAASMQSRINDLERQINALDAERREIADDQQRVRSNMNSIERRSDLYNRYLQKLNEQESRLEEMATQRSKLQENLESTRRELDDYLRNLDVE